MNSCSVEIMSMSFDGHGRPFPRWFPYLFARLAVVGSIVYFSLG